MALKKSELYSSLWQSCDELRGGMDASQYKDYVLVLLFIKYVSDKYAGAQNNRCSKHCHVSQWKSRGIASSHVFSRTTTPFRSSRRVWR